MDEGGGRGHWLGRPRLARPEPGSDSRRRVTKGRCGAGSVGAVAVKGAGFVVEVGVGSIREEQVVLGERGYLQRWCIC